MEFNLFCRSLLFSLYFYISVIVFAVFFVVVSPFINIKKRYSLTTNYIKILLKILRFICDINWKVLGKINSQKPVVIASNHQGLWESLYLQTLCNPLTTIIKREIIYVPFFGWAVNLLQPIKINRLKKLESAKKVIRNGSKRIKGGFSVLVFPEGTRKEPNTVVGKFARSAADLAIKNGVDLIPIYHDSGLYWRNKKFLKFPGTVQVVIGDPISGANSQEMTKNLEEWMNNMASMGTD